MLDRLGLADRAGDLVETLSGGLRRRVELAKGLLHRPRLLLLDEPSTGLDPGARSDLWDYLRHDPRRGGRDRRADDAPAGRSRQGRPDGDPERRHAGGARHARRAAGHGRRRFDHDRTDDPPAAGRRDRERFAIAARRLSTAACAWNSPTATSGSRGWSRRFPARSRRSRSASRRLEDVFIARTGHRFWQSARRWALADHASTRTSRRLHRRLRCSRRSADPLPEGAGRRIRRRGQAVDGPRGARLAVWSLCHRELVRFFRQRNRVVGAIGQPMMFWVLFGAGLGPSFPLAGARRERQLSRILLSRHAGPDPAVHRDLRHDLDHRRSPRGFLAVGPGGADSALVDGAGQGAGRHALAAGAGAAVPAAGAGRSACTSRLLRSWPLLALFCSSWPSR